MASKLINFEKAVEYMDPLQVTDYLDKILDFLKRNNSQLYFPSISPYVESFLVNLVSDTRNLKSKSFNPENSRLASEIVGYLETCRDVFWWTHGYENGNLLVYKKIFSNKMKKKPAKPSSIAHRLLQAQASDTKNPNTQNMDICELTPESTNHLPVISTDFKLRFLNKTLHFIKDDSETTLFYNEMPLTQTEYIYSLIKYRNKHVGLGYKSLYAPLWEAMEECSVHYNFEVSFKETGSCKTAILMLEKIPKNNKSRRNKEESKKQTPEIVNINVTVTQEEMSNNTYTVKQENSNGNNQSLNITSPAFPRLELLSDITERFFRDTVVALTDFADDESRASVVFHELSEQQVQFVKRVKTLAESSKVREMFSPEYRDLLWRLNYSIKEVLPTYKITTVHEKARSITLKKVPRFATPLPVAKESVTASVRSKSAAPTKTRDRSISRDRLIQFEKGGNLPAMDTLEPSSGSGRQEAGSGRQEAGSGRQERGRSDGLCKRKAKLLEDLSTPLESDKGIRMMRRMGWRGGALGARGDGLAEPLMPALLLPTRGGLGHVPPPKPEKVRPRVPVDFRMTVLHCLHDLLLHDEDQKEIQLKDPLVKKEKRFITAALRSLNRRQSLALTAREHGLVARVAAQLGPGLQVRPLYSEDLRTVTLQKQFDQPINPTKLCAPKPKSKPAKSPEVITITDDGIDVLITSQDVYSLIPHIDTSQLPQPTQSKAIRNRAFRLLLLTKFAEVLHWNQNRIIFKSQVTLSKKMQTFLRTIVDHLSQGSWLANLFGWEHQVFEDMRGLLPDTGAALHLEMLSSSSIILTRTPLTTETITIEIDNNNDDKTDNRNQMIVDDCSTQPDLLENHSQRIVSIVENNVDNLSLIRTMEQTIYNNHSHRNENDNGMEILEEKNAVDKANETIENDIDITIDIETNESDISTENETMEKVKLKMKTDFNIAEMNVEDMTNRYTNFEPKIRVRNVDELNDLDRDIQDLEMSILKADLNCVVKEEVDNVTYPHEEVATEADIILSVKEESETDTFNSKRSHSSSVCSQELDPKKVKISSEDDEHVLIITPKNQDKITEDIIQRLQTLMSHEIEKAGGFLPLVKCHGVQNGGLIYSYHDEQDIAWLRKVTSSVDVDIEIVANICLESKRQLLIKINSYIPLDTKKLFRKFELYNVGLDTKYWRVSHKHASGTFIMFIISVDEKSFKFISDEKFSLYCGIDKAQFYVIN